MNHQKLIITDFYQNHMLGYQMTNNRLWRVFDFDAEPVVGNIYCGYVKDVVKNIHAAFVEFDTDKRGYLSLENQANATLHQGDKVLVQVSADKRKTKDYTLTTHINLSTDTLVLTVGNTDISISRKISSPEERERLKSMFAPYKNQEYGWILRTNILKQGTEEIHAQAKQLIAQWEDIKRRFAHAAAKSALVRKDPYVSVCQEYCNHDGGDILTDNPEVYHLLQNHGLPVQMNDDTKVSLCNKYALEKHLREALQKKVWLKSGGYLVIEPTEALTVIDVNTGKADMKSGREKTFQKVNAEAAEEIIHQIQVRNLSGIVIVDFINMKEKAQYDMLQEKMSALAKTDFLPCFVLGFTRLGLLEISRKKREKPIYEIVSPA